jgi:hypothetical protein
MKLTTKQINENRKAELLKDIEFSKKANWTKVTRRSLVVIKAPFNTKN